MPWGSLPPLLELWCLARSGGRQLVVLLVGAGWMTLDQLIQPG